MVDSPKEKPTSKPAKSAKKRRLTLKQQAFIKEYIANKGNGTQAILKVYDCAKEETARSMSTENLIKPNIREALLTAFNSTGLTTSKIGAKLNQWVDSIEPDTSLRAIGLWGDFSGAKVHKLDVGGQVNINHKHSTLLQSIVGEDVIDVDAT